MTEVQWTEEDRLAALDRYQILDTPPDPDYDDVAKLVSEALGTPIAVVNLIARDRQWFKAELGIGARELPLDVSICAHAILQDDLMVVPDTRLDPRFVCNPLVTPDDGLRFYAGALLKTPEGLPIGTLCALDREPRPQGITPFQRLTLEVLARQVMNQLELRRALSRQRVEERRNRLIIENSVDYAIITLDPDGKVASWNKGARRLLGWKRDEILGQSYTHFLTPGGMSQSAADQELMTGQEAPQGGTERWHFRKDGSRFWAFGGVTPLVDDDGSSLGYLKIMRDLTQQYRDRASLAESEARTRLALDAAELGAWESTPDLEELTWDARTREFLGHTPDEPIDYRTSFLARIHPDDRAQVATEIAEALAPGGSGQVSVEYRTRSTIDGRERWIHAKGGLALRHDGLTKFVGTVRDISAEKNAEQHRQLLSAELVHRVKNTLAIVQAIVNHSLRSVPEAAGACKDINQRLTALGAAHDLLTHTEWTAASMRELAQKATRLHDDRSERISISGADIHLSARSALAFTMVFHELATNAAKYGALSNEHGCVRLSWRTQKDALIVCWEEIDGPQVNPPSRTGFGSRLIRGLASDLGGESTLNFAPSGVIWEQTSRLNTILTGTDL